MIQRPKPETSSSNDCRDAERFQRQNDRIFTFALFTHTPCSSQPLRSSMTASCFISGIRPLPCQLHKLGASYRSGVKSSYLVQNIFAATQQTSILPPGSKDEELTSCLQLSFCLNHDGPPQCNDGLDLRHVAEPSFEQDQDLKTIYLAKSEQQKGAHHCFLCISWMAREGPAILLGRHHKMSERQRSTRGYESFRY